MEEVLNLCVFIIKRGGILDLIYLSLISILFFAKQYNVWERIILIHILGSIFFLFLLLNKNKLLGVLELSI